MQLKYCGLSSQSFLAMKLLVLLLTFTSFAASSTGHSQTISLTVSSAPLSQVFKSIEKQTNYHFVYTRDQLQNTKPVTVNWKDITLTDALNQCLENQPLGWTLEDSYIIIKEKPLTKKVTVVAPVPLEITGTVQRENGEAVTGATIAVKSSELATATNEQGIFKLNGVNPGDVLVISSIGFETKEIRVYDVSQLFIVLKQKVAQLDEAIIVGYGVTSKRYNVGSVSKISSAEISKQPVANPLAAIQGRAPGVFVQTQNGLPGGNIKVQIRGQGSVAAGTNPLYIIDGVPFLSAPFSTATTINGANGLISPFSIINPSDIESIDILKDAEASAIYGSRAANGVVLITTKKGSVGKAKLDLNVYTGVNKQGRKIDLMGLEDYLMIRKEAFKNAGVVPTVSNAPDLLVWDQSKSTDWQEYIFGNSGNFTDVQAQISGGNTTTSFIVGGNLRTEKTVLPGDDKYTRAGSHLSVNHQSIDKKLLLSASVLFSRDHNYTLYDAGVANFINLAPNQPIYNPDGSFDWSTGTNPAAFLLRKAESFSNNLVTSANFRYKFLPFLSLKLNMGYSRTTLDRKALQPKAALSPATNPVSTASFAGNSQQAYILEPFLEYTKKWKKLNLEGLLGTTYQQTIAESWSVTGTNYSNDDLLSNIGAAGLLRTPSNSYVEHKYVSLFTRINARWLDKYILSFNFRRDGSTRFGPDKQFGNFGSVAGGWIFSNERFVTGHLSFLSFGKFRMSYGITGNDQIPDYAYLSSYGTGAVYQDMAGLRPLRLANNDYSWETNHKWDIGIDLGFWKDRLMLTATYYNNRSGNQLVPYPLPSQAGFNQYQANLPAVVLNKGFELELNSVNISHNKFNWKSSFNISFPTNKLLEYPGLGQSSYANNYIIGEDLSIVKRIHVLQIDPATGIPQYEDVNKDGKFTFPDDYQVPGKTSPDLFGGFNNIVSWKGIEATLFIQFVQQYSLGSYSYPGFLIQNGYAFTTERWQKPGDITRIPVPIVSSATPASAAVFMLNASSDYVFRNTSYIRLKNLQIAYSFPEQLLYKMHLQNLRVYLEGQNLLTWSGKTFMDPETLTGSTIVMPVMKQFAAGFNITL